MKLIRIACILVVVTLTNASISTKSTCFNRNLEELGCECSYPFYYTESCPNGILSLNCLFKNDSIDVAVNEMNTYCWTLIKLENIQRISSFTFENLGFDFQCNFKLKNVSVVDSLAFKTLNSDVELTIEIDSSHLVLNRSCFGFINAKEIRLINNHNLSLSTSLFQGSQIETLSIQYSTLNHFRHDSKFLRIINLIIDNCEVDHLMNDSHRISGFELINTIAIQSSGLTSLKPRLFSSCCANLVQLHLNDNLITSIDDQMLKGLDSLQYLNLENNPLASISDMAFSAFKRSLKKLNLKSTKLYSLEKTLTNMISLKEVLLGETRKLVDLASVINEKIEYLDLQNSNLLIKSHNLNDFFNEFDLILNSTTSNLLFVDARAEDINLNNYQFNVSYAENGKCLWFRLKKVLFRVNEDHECSCSLFYLYQNLTNFYFPYKTGEYFVYKQLTSEQVNNETLWKEVILPLMPKCYRKLWLETYNLDNINEIILKCGFDSISPNCTNIIHTTTTQDSTQSIPTSTPTIPTEIIKLKNTPVILSSTMVAIIVFIILIILKARHNYQSRFIKIFRSNFAHLTTESKELNNFSTSRQSFNVYSFDPERLTQQ